LSDAIRRETDLNKLNQWWISFAEIIEASSNGALEEAFGTGTAVVISPVGALIWNEGALSLNQGETGKLTQRLYKAILAIQNGSAEDKYGWTLPCEG